eukprot:scaffold9399_cov143-Isochrysis_galbana.AAC.1
MWPASVSRANARARVGRSGGAESRERADRTVKEASVAVNLSSQDTLKCSSATGPHNVAELQTSIAEFVAQ